MASLEEIRAGRLNKLNRLKQASLDPYPVVTERTHSISAIKIDFDKLVAKQESVAIAGRIRSWREQGAIIFADLDDGTGKIQVLVKKGEGDGAKNFAVFKETADIGDFISVKGTLFLTQKKEKTILVTMWQMLAKSLRPLPDKWHGLQDVEERLRRRYLDLLMSPAVKERFVFRSRLISALRTFLDQAGFLEVETPVLQPLYGGATAEPFATHHQTLNLKLYLRISDELYLKRLLVGGFPKVYEISKDFRNEGIDAMHHPEFTMLEFYEAFSDAEKQRTFVTQMLKTLIKELTGRLTTVYKGETLDWHKDFLLTSYWDLFKQYAAIKDPASGSLNDWQKWANERGVTVVENSSREKIMDAVYKKLCRPKIIQPTFIINYPKDYLPLAKRLPAAPELVDAFQLIAGGIELVKAFSELNDPLDQSERFKNQEKIRAAGEQETQPFDTDFIEALEYGMPPAGGVGIGIDRLTMLLTDTPNIREVILFPTLRPRH